MMALPVFVILALLTLGAGVFVWQILQAKLTLDAQPRIPAPSRLPAGGCAVVQDEAPRHLIAAIKDLRALTGWDLRSAKRAIDGEHVARGVSLEAAEQVVRLLETHGGKARIVEDPEAQVAVQSKPAASSRCPYCHGATGEDGEPSVACTACLARHHEACWDEHRQCAGCGHTERYAGVEQTEGRGRPPAREKGRPG